MYKFRNTLAGGAGYVVGMLANAYITGTFTAWNPLAAAVVVFGLVLDLTRKDSSKDDSSRTK